MKQTEDNNLTGHNYDGIEEFDNPLPRWWLLTFIGTVIFAVIYWVQYEIFHAPTQLAELKQDLTEIKARNKAQAPDAPADETQKEIEKMMGSTETISKAQQIYLGKCAVCHGNELQGNIGPNLVDEYWLHGAGNLVAILQVVKTGVPEKGMPTWEHILKDDELKMLVAFIGANRGTKPANPKAPQGEKIASPWYRSPQHAR